MKTSIELWNQVWQRPYTNYEKHHQVFWEKIRQKATGKILDLGCGSASCWKGLTRDLTGIDYSEKGIGEARKNAQGRFLIGNIENVPLNEKFNTIVLSGIINYYPDLTKIKSELKRLSNKDTLILITINVIKDFPDREWNKDTIMKEFSDLGSVIFEFVEKIGYFIEIISYN